MKSREKCRICGDFVHVTRGVCDPLSAPGSTPKHDCPLEEVVRAADIRTAEPRQGIAF